jgi:hypothetical protein
MAAIDASELNFDTKSMKGMPMPRYKDKLFKRGKTSRNHDKIINHCYWSCAKTACKAALRYSINVHGPQVNVESNGLGPGIFDIALTADHCYDICTTTPNDITKRVARTEVINQAATGKININN